MSILTLHTVDGDGGFKPVRRDVCEHAVGWKKTEFPANAYSRVSSSSSNQHPIAARLRTVGHSLRRHRESDRDDRSAAAGSAFCIGRERSHSTDDEGSRKIT